MSEAQRQPVVSGSQVVAAGLASATAAVVTSRFGVAGTLLGAAVTSMIITGGSAILKTYLESVTGTVRKVPRKVREKASRGRGGRPDASATIPGRPDLRENFMGRMRAAMGWFSHLPTLRRRSIMVRGFLAAAVAFVIGMAAIYAVESGIGNSLSCGFWSNCPEGATPGVHFTSDSGTGTSSSLSLARPKTETAPQTAPQDPSVNPAQQDSGTPSSGTPSSGTPDAQPAPAAEDPVVTPEVPAEDPAKDPAAAPETPAAPAETPTETPTETPSGTRQAPASSGTGESSP